MTSWNTRYPGLIVFLIDESQSMGRQFKSGKSPSQQRMCDVVADITNEMLQKLIKANTVFRPNKPPVVRTRADVALLGYGNGMVHSLVSIPNASSDIFSLSAFDANPREICSREEEKVDRLTAKTVKTEVKYPVWVLPKAEGNTPMVQAFSYAYTIAEQWVKDHSQSPGPVFVNITDGEANDSTYEGDLYEAAQALMSLKTDRGNASLYSIHLTAKEETAVEYPAAVEELPDDPYAQALFAMSSEIPPEAYPVLSGLLNRTLPPHARGMVFNGDPTSLLRMFHFASMPAVPVLNPNG